MALSDKEQKELGKEIQVGPSQIGNPTPMIFKYIFRAYTFLVGIWAIIAPSFDLLPPSVVDDINKYLLIGVPVMHYAIKFFGWDYKED